MGLSLARIVSVALLLVLTPSVVVAQVPDDLTASRLAWYYQKMAFFSEPMVLGELPRRHDHLSKYPVGQKFGVLPMVSDPDRSVLVNLHIASVFLELEQKATSFDGELWGLRRTMDFVRFGGLENATKEGVGILIVVAERNFLLRVARHQTQNLSNAEESERLISGFEHFPTVPVCFGFSAVDPQTREILFSSVFVQDGPHLVECLYEELMQVFGIGNDLDESIDTIFDNRIGHVTSPTELDWLLWKIHTHPDLRPGMELKPEMDVVRRLASELLDED